LKPLILTLALVLGACSSTSTSTINTIKLIALSEQSAPNGVQGTFNFLIKATGNRRGDIFLNTEDDYKDRRAITIVLSPKVSSDFTSKYGSTPDLYFINKTIEVTGEAKREKIYFYSKGRVTTKYYYQTHIDVTSLDQIKI